MKLVKPKYNDVNGNIIKCTGKTNARRKFNDWIPAEVTAPD